MIIFALICKKCRPCKCRRYGILPYHSACYLYCKAACVVRQEAVPPMDCQDFYRTSILSPTKRSPFLTQKESFSHSKGVLFSLKRSPFLAQKEFFFHPKEVLSV